MRISKLHEGKPWQRLESVAKFCRYNGCVTEWDAYKERCKHGRGDEPMSKIAQTEMSKARNRALSVFQYGSRGESHRITKRES